MGSMFGYILGCCAEKHLWFKYNKYIIYEHYDKNNPSVKWYSAEVANLKIFWCIPIYTQYRSLFSSDKNGIYWNSKENLLNELNKDFEFEDRKRNEKNRKIITHKINN